MTFREFLDRVVLPMFPGVEIRENAWRRKRKIKSLVSLVAGANRIRIRENVDQPSFHELERAQAFEPGERQFMKNLVEAFADVKTEAEAFLSELEDEIVRGAIAKTVAPGRISQQRAIAKILAAYSNWPTQTYEGERVSSGCTITRSHFPSSARRLELAALITEDFAKGLTDGVDSWWRIASIGGVRRLETSDDETTPRH